MFVYKVTNLIDGKCYVGKTRRSLEERFKEHSKANSGLGNAIRELGIEKFKIEVLEGYEEFFTIHTFGVL